MEVQLAVFSSLPASQRFLCEDLTAPQSSVKNSVGARQNSPEAQVALLVLHIYFLGEFSLSWFVGGSSTLICHCVLMIPKLISAHTEQNFIPQGMNRYFFQNIDKNTT